MGTVRAGMPFTAMDDEAKRQMGHGFTCQKLDDRVRSCRLITDGPVGVMKVVTDRSDRAAVIQFLVSDSSSRWIETARQQDAEWNLVHKSQPPYSELTTSVTRWESDNHRWSAQLSRQQTTNRPVEMMMTDANRLGRIAAANPSILLRLVNEGMISRADMIAAEKYASNAMVRVTDSMSAEGAALARKASALPRCPPKPGDQIVGGDGLRTTMGRELSAVAEQTVARAYPGSRLVLGERAAYLIDAAGAAEEVLLFPNEKSVESNLYAFAVAFPRRVATAESAAKAFQTDAQCRAPGEIIVASLDPTSRAVVDYQRVEVDGESLSSVVGTLDFTPSSSGRPALVATYLATYGGPQWNGQVKWNALIDVSHPLAVSRRAPVSCGKTDPDGVMSGGILVADGDHRDDPYGFSIEPGPAARMSVLDATNPTAPAKRVFLLAEPGGLANGWTLLSQL